MDKDSPICVVHLEAERSEDIEIIEEVAPSNFDGIKIDRYTDKESRKLEIDIDINRDGLITVKQEEVDEQMNIENDKFTNIEKESEVIEIIDEMGLGEVMKKELSEELDIIEQLLDGQTEAELNNVMKDSKDVALTENSSLDTTLYECGICKKKFKEKSNWKRHYRIHLKDGPFECNICHKRFMLNRYLTAHLHTHSGNTPFQCEICEKRFKLKDSLRVHFKRTHTGERPLECEICKKRFNHRSVFNVHLKTHMGEKPFQCQICERSFVLKSELELHLNCVHTAHIEERLLKCSFCGKQYKGKKGLNSHLKSHSREAP